MTQPKLGPYDTGATTFYSYRGGPFNYCLYVPKDLDRSQPIHLIVVVHGSDRKPEKYRDAFAEEAAHGNTIVLAPLFPVNVKGDGNSHGYKYMIEGDIRYDLVVLGMIDEVVSRYQVELAGVLMFGFSGGGHFTHRFLLLHPERLKAVSIVGPGSVTLIDDERDWWVGTRDMEAIFGKKVNPEALRQVDVHMSVGALDTETWEITHTEGGRYWMPDCNHAGVTRIDRLHTLKASLEQAGCHVSLELIPGSAHSFANIIRPTRNYFWRIIKSALYA